MVNVTVTSAGTSGPRGSGWLTGVGAPSSATGFDGDMYLDTTNVGYYYGPKTSGAWGTPNPFGNSLNGVPLYNVVATTDPGASNDSVEGYSRGSIWVNTSANRSFICTDASTGAALWTQTLTANMVASGTPAYGRVLTADTATTSSWQITPGLMSSTGVVYGGSMSINGTNPSAFDIVETMGYVADYTSNPNVPTIVKVTLPAQTVTITGDPATRGTNWWVADSTGTISSVGADPPTPTQRRSYMLLGATASVVGTGVIVAIAGTPDQLTQTHNQLLDLMYGLGPFSISGNTISPNGVNLSFNKSAGSGFFANFSAATDPNNPHTETSVAETPATFRYATQLSGSTSGSFVTTISPGFYDVGGVITAIPGGTNTSTIQRVYLFGTGGPPYELVVQYGQTAYGSLSAAVAAVGTTAFTVNPDFVGVGTLIGWICLTKSATDLSNATQATFIQAPNFAKP